LNGLPKDLTLKQELGSVDSPVLREFVNASGTSAVNSKDIVYHDTLFFDHAANATNPWTRVCVDPTGLAWTGDIDSYAIGVIPQKATLSVLPLTDVSDTDNTKTPIILSGVSGFEAADQDNSAFFGSCSAVVPRTETPHWVSVGTWNYRRMLAEGFDFQSPSNANNSKEMCRFSIIDSDSGDAFTTAMQFRLEIEYSVTLPPRATARIAITDIPSINGTATPVWSSVPALVKALRLENSQ